MKLSMNPILATSYKSRSQIARVVTENWVASTLYCAACDCGTVTQAPNNSRAVDFTCQSCSVPYQLKSGSKWNEHCIPDAGYNAMIAAIKSDKVPNLLVMQYSQTWSVRNLVLIPSFFFIESAIQKRAPLSLTARRAGWVGCNILLSVISPEGKIRLVTNDIPADPELVRQQYRKLKPIATLKAGLRGWALNVLKAIHEIGKPKFDLSDVYAFESNLATLYPGNSNIRAKIRQQLQVLRDFGLIQFLGGGRYAIQTTKPPR